MGSTIGNRKAAAARIGMPVERYLQLLAQGRKRCSRCKRWKPTTFFYEQRSRPDGLAQTCMVCSREQAIKRWHRRQKVVTS